MGDITVLSDDLAKSWAIHHTYFLLSVDREELLFTARCSLKPSLSWFYLLTVGRVLKRIFSLCTTTGANLTNRVNGKFVRQSKIKFEFGYRHFLQDWYTVVHLVMQASIISTLSTDSFLWLMFRYKSLTCVANQWRVVISLLIE